VVVWATVRRGGCCCGVEGEEDVGVYVNGTLLPCLEHRAENQLNTSPMPHPKSRKFQRLPHATPIDDVQSFCPH
jgi:hypothetical protein